jgi:hypothetical protein
LLIAQSVRNFDCHFVIGIGALAAGKEPVLAKETFAAGDGERHHYPIADFQLLVVGADLDDLAHVFMTEHVPAFHPRNDAVVNVKIGATNRAGRDFYDGIAWVLDSGIGNRLAANVMLSMPGQSFHTAAPCVQPVKTVVQK